MIAAASAAAPAAADAAGVTVRLRGVERHVGPREISAALDRPAGSYLLRAEGTAAEPVAHPPALSLRGLVALAGGSPDAVSFVTIARPNGTLALLTRADLAEPPPFPEGPPIIWMDAGGTRYLRPLRGPGDANASDNLDITGGDLIVSVHAGPLLAVRAEADRRTVAAGEPVELAARVSGATPGQPLRFDWSFGDGSGATGQVVPHRFRAPGVYDAIVTVNGSDDSGGSSPPLRIRVGPQHRSDSPTGGGSGADRRTPARGGAGDGESTTTAAPPPSSPSPAPGDTTSARDSPRSRPSPSISVPQPPAARSTPPHRRASRPRPRTAKRAGTVVSGTLVSARFVGPRAATRAAAAAARRGADPVRGRVGPAGGVVAVIALLGLGVWRERRGLRRPPGVAS